MPLRLLAAVVAGLALTASFEPLAWWWLLVPAVAVFVLACHGTTAGRGLLVGLVFGLSFWFSLIVWMRVIGVGAYVGLAGFMTLYCALTGWGTAVLVRLRGWPVWVACWWLAVEVLRTWFPFGGFTWGRLGFAVIDTPAQSVLPLIGVHGASLALALLGALLALVVVRLRGRPAVAEPASSSASSASSAARSGRRHVLGPSLGLVAVAALLCLPTLHPWSAPVERQVEVAAVQGNVPGRGDDLVDHHREVSANQVETTIRYADEVRAGERPAPDFVVWPENSTAIDPFRNTDLRDEIDAAVEAIDVPVLVGAMVDPGDPETVLNQGIVWDPETGPGDRYAKRHPVPFGEFVPYRRHLNAASSFGRLSEVPRDMMAGTRRLPLDVGGVRVADAICFDVAYDDGIYDQLSRGGQVVVVQTSNASFIRTHQLDQQWAMSRVRAVETGRYVVVAAVNGISGIVAPDGSVVATTPIRTQDVVAGRVGLIDTNPPALGVAPLLGAVATVVSLLALAWALLSKRRRRDRRTDDLPERESDRAAVAAGDGGLA